MSSHRTAGSPRPGRSRHDRFAAGTREAICNHALHGLLEDVTGRLMDRRTTAIGEVSDWEDLRDQAKAIKLETLRHLDRYLTAFEQQVVAHGGVVHWAPTAADAARTVCDLALAQGVSRVVKSKSMVTEELRLNDALAETGISVVETDLGEYIVQLAGERPSHIIAPALHKSRQEVGRLFADKLGVAYTESPEALTQHARQVLRAEFAAADMGISGANFAVAESGTVVVVENEGNARLTTSLPRIHVVLMGIEKVIPRIDDLGVFLTLLPRSATGQPMSSYVSFITGPRRSGELDGPDQLHVVIVDNGRSALLADPGAREALACIRCGACLNACPVYRSIGGHAYGAVYAGPIGSIVSTALDRDNASADLPFASTLCGVCRSVCPVKIDIPKVLLHLRGEAMAGGLSVEPLAGLRTWKAAMGLWAGVVRSPWWYRFVSKIARSALRAFARGGRVSRLPGPLGGWTRARDFPVPARRSFREMWEVRARSGGWHDR